MSDPKYMDTREGLPSASLLERLWLCPGSWNMGRGLPELTTPETRAWAESGNRIHLWLEAPDAIDLAAHPEELEVAERCLEQQSELLAQVFGAYAPGTVYREERFWYDTGSRKRFSAKLDFAAIGGQTALVIDYKTSRGEVTESARNLQLRSQAVLLWIKMRRAAEAICTAIVQPLAGKPELCRYGPDDLQAAEQELVHILDATEQPGAPLRAGEKQCRFCSAQLKCPAAARVLRDVAEADLPAVEQLAGADLATLLDKCRLAKRVMKTAEAHAKESLRENPTSIPGWSLKAGAPQREITNAFGLFETLFQAGLMDRDTFLRECVSVGIGAVEKALARRNGLKPGQARQLMDTHVQAFLSQKLKDASLERME